MQPRIVLQINFTAAPFSNLNQITGHNLDPCAECTAIAFDADQIDEQKVIAVSTIIAQQSWRAIQIVYYHVDVAVIVEIAKCGATTDGWLTHRRTDLRANLSKCAVAVVAVTQLALRVGDSQLAAANCG